MYKTNVHVIQGHFTMHMNLMFEKKIVKYKNTSAYQYT